MQTNDTCLYVWFFDVRDYDNSMWQAFEVQTKNGIQTVWPPPDSGYMTCRCPYEHRGYQEECMDNGGYYPGHFAFYKSKGLDVVDTKDVKCETEPPTP